MLLDMLGILVGFIAVMLLLSLVVTALTEILQSLLRLRPRNLTFGLTALLEQALAPAPGDLGAEGHAEASAAAAPSPRQASELARGIMRLHRFQPGQAPAGGAAAAGIGMTVGAAIAPAPPLSSIDLKAVEDGLARQGAHLTPQQTARLRQLFPEAQASMRARFERNVKRVALALAVVVAVLMQVSSFSLLARLSDDAEFRARAVASGERLADAPTSAQQGALILAPRSYEDASAAALAELQRRRPEAAEYLEQASGIGASRADILAELDLILTEEQHPNRTALLEEYAGLLDAEHERRFGQSIAQLGRAEGELAALDIRPWQFGWGYYRRWDNVVGVAITAILISLGAPFWHDLLRKTVSILRDVRSEPPRPAGYGASHHAVAEAPVTRPEA